MVGWTNGHRSGRAHGGPLACVLLLCLSAGCRGDNAGATVVTAAPIAAPIDTEPGPAADALPASEVAAIVRLGETGVGPPPEHDDEDPAALGLADLDALFDDIAIARSSIADLDTVEEAAALGYVLATVPSPGIGTHWVRWSQIEQPFDLRRPAMLLFDHDRTPPELVGYSYTVQSPEAPTGFAGDLDRWHRHHGLCVTLDGWVVRERSGPDDCDGSFVAGGDFWMLHAWIVTGWGNRDGFFAPMNPKLCPPDAGTPDFLRCPDDPGSHDH